MPELPQPSVIQTDVTPGDSGLLRYSYHRVCLSASLSLRVVFQSRRDRSSATGLNPSGGDSTGTTQQPSHIIIPMTASCHEQHHTALMTNAVDLWDTCISHLAVSAPPGTIWDIGVQ